MKSIGIVRAIDQLGRVVIPMELRKTMNIKDGTPMEIFVDRGDIVIRKYQEICVICNDNVGTIKLENGKSICSSCKKEIQKLTE